ncbi:unnamed protein product, partial [Durusdinium trenchii]
MVRTHVKLVVEEDNTANMTKALTATAFPKWRGEDSKVCGEAATQPSIRLPPLREGRRVKLLHSAISLRMDKDKGTIGSGDGILLLDGGRDGLGPSLLGAVKPSPTETMSKHKTCKFLIWDEGAIRSKKHRNRGSQVNQLERVYLILPEDMQVTYKKRKHYSGTSAGDCLGPIIAPAWDDMDETWNATYALKKVMYGAANRVAVGGKPDGEPAENAKGARRKDTDQEPMAYHAMPSEVADSALRARLKQVHDPPVLSSDCLKIMKIERPGRQIFRWVAAKTRAVVDGWAAQELDAQKSQAYEFPKSESGRKRLKQGLKRIAKDGGDTDDCWKLGPWHLLHRRQCHSSER